MSAFFCNLYSMRSIFWIFLFLFSCFSGQTIHFNFPHFAGQDYTFSLIKGDKNDTIAKGKIPQNGQFSIDLHHKNYVGMAKWTLKKGGGLALVVTNKNFTVECLDPVPNRSNIRYIDSIENLFLNQNYQQQQDILKKYDAMLDATKAYSKKDALYSTFENEYHRIIDEYKGFRKALKANPSYAAEFRRISDAVSGLGDEIYLSEKDRAVALNKFITSEMRWDALYTSGHWNGIISYWFEIHLKTIKDDSLFVNDIKTALSRIKDDTIYTAMVEKTVTNLMESEKSDLVQMIKMEIQNSGKMKKESDISKYLNAVK